LPVADLSRALTDPDPSGLEPNLARAATLLEDADTADLLGDLLDGSPAAEALLPEIEAVDHVGAITLASTEEARAALESVGFDERLRLFESTILTRELTRLARGDGQGVPVSLLKAWGRSGCAAELAMPAGVETECVAEWIRAGVGAHLAFRVVDLRQLSDAEELLASAGFRHPAGVGPGPQINPEEGIAAAFFERRPAQPLGLELCHYVKGPLSRALGE